MKTKEIRHIVFYGKDEWVLFGSDFSEKEVKAACDELNKERGPDQNGGYTYEKIN